MSNKKVFELVSVIIGTFIGAGFVSGREVATYFSRFGFVGCVCAILEILFFYIFIKYCLHFGKKYNNGDKKSVSNNKMLQTFVNIVVVLSAVINVGAMIAGVYSIGNILYNDLVAYALVVMLILLTILALKYRYNGMRLVNIILVPVLVILIAVIALTTIANSSTITMPNLDVLSSVFGGVVSSIIYVFFNMLLLGVLLIKIGYKYSTKEIERSSRISSIIIGIMILVITLSITLSATHVMSSDMPLLAESINMGSVYSVIFAICQFCGIYTTIISSSYITVDYLNRKFSSYNFCVFITILLGIFVSLFGFSNIVKYLYSLTGVFSIMFFVLLLSYSRKSCRREFDCGVTNL
ncbi:MAG: hypothetical protein E7361_01635 [Clostridiales bacterium]|nr:hypothetical protein [Clostridiales bacterium]